jgi:hypothetical protein
LRRTAEHWILDQPIFRDLGFFGLPIGRSELSVPSALAVRCDH